MSRYSDTIRESSSDRWLPRAAKVALPAVGALAMAMGGASAAFAQTGPAGGDDLTCTGKGVSHFAPMVTKNQQEITFQGSGQLENCSSPNGSRPYVKSGLMAISGKGKMALAPTGSGPGECRAKGPFRGHVKFTWLDERGRQVGTSVLLFKGERDPYAGKEAATHTEGRVAGLVSSLFQDSKIAADLKPVRMDARGDCNTGVTRIGYEFTAKISSDTEMAGDHKAPQAAPAK